MNPQPTNFPQASLSPRLKAPSRAWIPILLIGGSYFIHFLALGFASFPLQTHLRQLLSPSSASLIASVIPVAACLTYFIFRFAEARMWTQSPQRLLAIVAVLVCGLQWLLGWRLQGIGGAVSVWDPVVDAAVCLLLMGCAHSTCMTLLNHIGIATLGKHAFTVRAAGSAGYMLAVVLMGTLWSDPLDIANHHLFIACAISGLHAAFAVVGYVYLSSRPTVHLGSSHDAPVAGPGSSGQPKTSKSVQAGWAWWGLLALVWMVAMCEMSYGLYAHEFLTKTYGSNGYFLFAGAIAIEIALLLGMPWLPTFHQRLLFVGPLGWMALLGGCLIALGGIQSMGIFALALALNCPFQISANEHAHKINGSILGVASMALAQSLGYMSATLLSALVSDASTGPRNLWLCTLPIAGVALILAIYRLARGRQPVVATSPLRLDGIQLAIVESNARPTPHVSDVDQQPDFVLAAQDSSFETFEDTAANADFLASFEAGFRR